MKNLNVMEARKSFSKTINRVAFGKERIVLERHGEAMAVLVPMEDAKFLDELEDRLDVEAARAALKDTGPNVPWEKVKKSLGL